jgi:Na+/H+ antiporter NhaD/arsenite permease-like protein
MVRAVILFAVSYAVMLAFPKIRAYAAVTSGIVFVASGMLPIGKIWSATDANVILMLIGIMGLVALFTESGMPSLIAELIIERVPNVRIAAVSLALFTGIISAFVDNVATVLMLAPVGIEICRRLDTDPVPFIIGIAVSSNLQGAATLVGDTTAIMLGSALDMSFNDFFFYHGRPSVFFAVEIGAVIAAVILYYIFRRETKKIPHLSGRTHVTDLVPSVLLVLLIAVLIGISFIPDKPDHTNGMITCAFLLAGITVKAFAGRGRYAVGVALSGIDFETVTLLVGLFIMIGGLENMGVVNAVAEYLTALGGGHVFTMYTVVVFGSVLISAFIDNIPYTATMLPIIISVASRMNIDPTPLCFGLICGSTLGGNCTPVGAAANVTGIGILRREGYSVRNSDFFRIGIPFTVAAIIPAYIYIWVFFGV